jgi:hypothetical protein
MADPTRESNAPTKVTKSAARSALLFVFLIVVVAAIVAGGWEWNGPSGAIASLSCAILGIWLWAGWKSLRNPLALACWLMLTGLTASLLWPGVNHRPPGPRASCLNNLKQLVTALLIYERTYGRFPPAHTVDANGKPLQSWRTLILPYLDQQELFQQIHLDEPWDSPHNVRLTSSRYELFHCPFDDSSDSDTSYVAVIGPGTAWDSKDGTKLSDIADGPENTILLVEMKNSGIKWAEPRDLDLDHLPPGITKDNLLKSLSNHPGCFNAVFADGATAVLPSQMPWSDFAAMLTIAGGEKVDRFKW